MPDGHGVGPPNGPEREAIVAECYDELRGLARRLMSGERRGHTLQPTAIVNELYLRLDESPINGWQTREEFRAIAATCIRRILLDHARRRSAKKRGGGLRCLSIDSVDAVVAPEQTVDLVDLDDALRELEQRDPDQAQVVELRFFGGLSVDECAKVVGVTERCVQSRWRFARAWLKVRLDPSE